MLPQVPLLRPFSAKASLLRTWNRCYSRYMPSDHAHCSKEDRLIRWAKGRRICTRSLPRICNDHLWTIRNVSDYTTLAKEESRKGLHRCWPNFVERKVPSCAATLAWSIQRLNRYKVWHRPCQWTQRSTDWSFDYWCNMFVEGTKEEGGSESHELEEVCKCSKLARC